MALSKEERRKARKKDFWNFMETLFPDGNIPSEEEIFQKVKEGDTTVRTYFVNKMYTDGVPVDNFLLQDFNFSIRLDFKYWDAGLDWLQITLPSAFTFNFPFGNIINTWS